MLNCTIDWTSISFDEKLRRTEEAFNKFFGFTRDFSKSLVLDVYLDERPQDRELLRLWQSEDIAVEYRYIQIRKPEADEEGLIELLRDSIRNGEVSIAFLL